jgi:hypothetical protein
MGEYRRREAFHDWLNDNLMNVPYDSGDPRLQDPPVDHSTDCSGSMWRGLRHGAGLLYPPVLSWTMAREWVDSHPLSVDDAMEGVFAPPMPGPDPVDFAALVHAAHEKAARDMVPIRDGGVELKQGMGTPGSPDERVRTAQRAVNLAIDGKLVEDGEFGKDTHDAVLWFQLVFYRGMPWEQTGTVTTNTAAGVIFHLLLRNQSQSVP